MFEVTSFHQYYEYGMYIAIFGAVVCALVFFWPSPEWVREADDPEELEELLDQGRQSDGKPGTALSRAILLIVISVMLTALITFFGNVPPLFGGVLGVAIVAMVYPTIINLQVRSRQRQGRKEAMGIAEFVSGRMSAEAPLFESLENLYAEYTDGKRELPICGEDLGDLIRRVRLGNELPKDEPPSACECGTRAASRKCRVART